MKKLLIIGFTWPEPATTAAGSRMLQLIRFFLGQDYHITFGSTAKETEYSMDLESLGINKVPLLLNDSGFDVFVKELAPNIVLFDRFLTEEQFGWRVAEFAPNSLRILDTEDLHSLRHVREKCQKNAKEFSSSFWKQDNITKREVASIYRCDLSLIISDYEMKLLEDVLNIDSALLYHLPFMLEPITNQKIWEWLKFDDRKDIICIGNGKHAPNVDALQWAVRDIWPMIRKELPKVHLKIYGAYFHQKLKQLHNPEKGIWVEGWVEDIDAIAQNARLVLAPLRFGAGAKGKLIIAMQNGTPSITTSIGAEGMYEDYKWPGKIADNANNLVQAVITLYQNESEWESAQENGIELINTFYSAKRHSQYLNMRLQEVQKNLEKHRDNNFVGSLLMQNTLSSTKYMAKWIEAKNDKN
ncbi:glycosyltransferase [Ulvibacterium marinum]|uniref:glycosyltransferase n=1 Tax=Ulvibacterium marinum TaxID=2419782 RepID=UPI0024945FC8|nr:glycosyltransferase [Ulvibacterium marinum]